MITSTIGGTCGDTLPCCYTVYWAQGATQASVPTGGHRYPEPGVETWGASEVYVTGEPVATQDLYVDLGDLDPPRVRHREWRRWAAPVLAGIGAKAARVVTAVRWTRGRAPRGWSHRTLRRLGVDLRR